MIPTVTAWGLAGLLFVASALAWITHRRAMIELWYEGRDPRTNPQPGDRINDGLGTFAVRAIKNTPGGNALVYFFDEGDESHGCLTLEMWKGCVKGGSLLRPGHLYDPVVLSETHNQEVDKLKL